MSQVEVGRKENEITKVSQVIKLAEVSQRRLMFENLTV
jgi:hypothetical protein